MTLRAFPHNLFAPAFEIPELTKVEDQFSEKWLGQHEVPEEPLFHYTTAHGMRGILEERSLWLSDVTSFNDPGEIEYGKRLVSEIMGDFERQETSPVVRTFLAGMRPFVESFGTLCTEYSWPASANRAIFSVNGEDTRIKPGATVLVLSSQRLHGLSWTMRN